MNMIKTTVNIGVGAPFRVIHISDTHLTYADMRDGERKVTLADSRKKYFTKAERVLTFAQEYSKENALPIIHTGDLIDFVSVANLEAVKRFTQQTDCFAVAGNHEFSLYVGEAKEDAAYRNQSLDAVQKAFQNNIRMSSRVIGGVNFVALDNGYYLFEEEQLLFLEKEVDRGLPTVLLLHNPLYEQVLYERVMQESSSAYLVGVPEVLMQSYPLDRFEQQKADEITCKVVEYIQNQPQIKAIIAGHLHFNYEGIVANRIPQIVTSCTDIREIEFI